MSVRFRSSSAQMNVAGTSTNTITVTKPTQTADGDLMIAMTVGPVNTVTPPAGWTQMRITTATLLQVNFYKRVAASEGANYVFGFSTSDTCGVSIATFFGARDVHIWNVKDTGVDNPAFGYTMDAARDSIGHAVFAWQDTATATMSWTQNSENYDTASSNTGATRFRGISGATFGPTAQADIVNIGDSLPSAFVTQSQPVAAGLWFSMLIDGEAADTEPWSSTDGDFAVELKLDDVEVNSTGGIESRFRGDFTYDVQTVSGTPAISGGLGDEMLDSLAGTYGFLNASAGYFQYQFPTAYTAYRYRLMSGPTVDDRDPADWTLQGSNDGSAWTVIDTRQGEAFIARGQWREFNVTTPGSYTYYRLNITNNSSSNGTNAVRVSEWRLSQHAIWEDITTRVNEESKIRITRGLQSSSGRSDFSRAYFELNNTDGRFSMRNPASPYFRSLQRNTQTRISKAYGTKSLQLQGAVRLEGTDMCGDGIRTPVRSATALASDMEWRFDIQPDSWRDAQHLAGVSVADGSGNRPWTILLLDDGRLQLTRTVTGGTEFTYTSTEAVPQGGRQSIKVTIDTNNGASGSTALFYWAPSIDGSYTQIGDPVIQATTSSTVYTGGAMCVGHIGSLAGRGLHGQMYEWRMYSLIGGTIVSQIDFTAQTNGSHAWTENSNAWVAINNAVVSNRRFRFHGEVAEWPLSWDRTGSWIVVGATGAGVQKRLERGGGSPLSTMRRYHTKGIIADPGAFERFSAPFNYWPMEDLPNTFTIASGIPGKAPMQIYGNPNFTTTVDVFQESLPLIQVNGAKFGGKISGATSGYADIRFMWHVPTNPVNSADIMEIFTTGTAARIALTHESAGQWRLRAYEDDDSGAPFWDSGNIAIPTVTKACHVQLVLEQISTTVFTDLYVYDVFGTLLGSETVFGFVNATMGRVHRINTNPEGLLVDAYLGHLAVYGRDAPVFAGAEMNAHHYETAAARMRRLCYEEAIEFRHAGALAETQFMGFQEIDSAFPLMSTSAHSDDGFLIDPLDAFGIEYRTNRSLMNQAAAVTVSYTGNELSGELTPLADDSYIVNDFVAARGGAGSARAQETEGPLSILPPPDGVSSYEQSQNYSLAHEGQCTDIAFWQVHKGTLDEERYPRIELALENLRIAADPVLTEAILQLDVGERVDIIETPDFLPPHDIQQIVIGYEEWFDNFQHNFKLNTLPFRPFAISSYDTGDRFEGRAFVSYDIEPADTTISVTTQDGLKWSPSAVPFDIRINEEVMTITAVQADETSTDSFNRANSTTNLGSTDGGVVQAWQQDLGTWGINGNAAYISAAANSIATINAEADFEEVSFTVPTWASGEAWLNFRFSSVADRLQFGGTVGTDAACRVITASAIVRTETADTAGNAFVLAAGDKLGVRANGSVIECFINDQLALTFSETAHQTSTRVGMQTATTAPRFDNFVYDDGAAFQFLTATRGVNGDASVHFRYDTVQLADPPYRGI